MKSTSGGSRPDLTPQQKMSIDFASVTEAVFGPRCISCHAQYTSYEVVSKKLSQIQSRVASNNMPSSGGPLSDAQKAILNAWIANGAPENVSEIPLDEPDETDESEILAPHWESIYANVIAMKCLTCHNPKGSSSFLDLSSRQAVFDKRNKVYSNGQKFIDFDQPEQSFLLHIIEDEDEPMPPSWSGIERVTEEEINTLELWIRLGLP